MEVKYKVLDKERIEQIGSQKDLDICEEDIQIATELAGQIITANEVNEYYIYWNDGYSYLDKNFADPDYIPEFRIKSESEIRSILNAYGEGKSGTAFLPKMYNYCGQVTKLMELCLEDSNVKLDTSPAKFWWEPEWVEYIDKTPNIDQKLKGFL